MVCYPFLHYELIYIVEHQVSLSGMHTCLFYSNCLPERKHIQHSLELVGGGDMTMLRDNIVYGQICCRTIYKEIVFFLSSTYIVGNVASQRAGLIVVCVLDNWDGMTYFYFDFVLFKGTVCNISGDLLAEMEYNIQKYVFISV